MRPRNVRLEALAVRSAKNACDPVQELTDPDDPGKEDSV